MKTDIHPKWFPEASVTCSCGNTWVTGATVAAIKTDICSKCHPFYTGEQRIVDTEGQVDRFMKRLQVRDTKRAEAEAAVASRTPAGLAIADLGLGKRQVDALAAGSINTAGEAIALLEAQGDAGLLAIDGVGQKALIDLKRSLRARGYELPGDSEEAAGE
jgi:large subunit ribosomal protein L31